MTASGDSIASSVARMMSLRGQTMVLKRAGHADVTLKGKRIGGSTVDVGNGDQQSFRVLIGVTELQASAWSSKVPTAGGNGAADTLTVDGRVRAVLDVLPLGDGDVVALYELEVAG